MLNTEAPTKKKAPAAKVKKEKPAKKVSSAKKQAKTKDEKHPRETPLMEKILAVNPDWTIFSIKKDGSVIFDTHSKKKTAVMVDFPTETLKTIERLLDAKPVAKEPVTKIEAAPAKKILLPPKAEAPKLALIFDTETTGLIENRTIELSKQPEVIEFYGAMVNLDTGEIVREFETLIKPKKLPLPEKIVQITSITDEMLKGELPFVNHYYDIEKMIREADSVIAHNLKYDSDMLEIEFERLGRTITWPKKICTVEATLPMKGFRLNLGRLYDELFKEKFDGAHRAKADVQALIRCTVELRKRGVI